MLQISILNFRVRISFSANEWGPTTATYQQQQQQQQRNAEDLLLLQKILPVPSSVMLHYFNLDENNAA